MKTLFLILSAFTLSLTAQAKEICPTSPQHIVVIDLKSGWWSGDGGNFGARLIADLEKRCPTSLKFEYRHRLGGYGGGFGFGNFSQTPTAPSTVEIGTSNAIDETNPTKGFPQNGWDSPSQIWLLSGGEADMVDLRIESEEFKGYLAGMVQSGANLFIGASFGNIYHANALTRGLDLGDLFKTQREAHEYPRPDAGVSAISHLTKGVELSDSPLFKGIDKIPADLMVGGYRMVSDSVANSQAVEAAATRTNGDIEIATLTVNDRKMVLDAGMHRFYGIDGNEVEARIYLQNILIELSK